MARKPYNIIVKFRGMKIRLSDANQRRTLHNGTVIWLEQTGPEAYRPMATVPDEVDPQKLARRAPRIVKCEWREQVDSGQ